MTVEEFRQLPEDDGPVHHELRNGEVVAVTRPKYKHYRRQVHLVHLLEPIVGERGCVGMEFAFRALPEYELRAADVAFLSAAREAAIDPDDNLRGAPDLVIEILSSSNMAREMNEREDLCLSNGCREFWVIDDELRLIKVTRPDRIAHTYRSGDAIPIPIFDNRITVDEALRFPVND